MSEADRCLRNPRRMKHAAKLLVPSLFLIGGAAFAGPGSIAPSLNGPIGPSQPVYPFATWFDGHRINQSFVESLAQGPVLSWSFCYDVEGDKVDDCLFLTEQDNLSTITTRMMSAHACGSASTTCHGSYDVVVEYSMTLDEAETEPDGSFSADFHTQLRHMDHRSGPLGFRRNVLADLVRLEGTIEASRNRWSIDYRIIGADGTVEDSGNMSAIAGSTGAGDRCEDSEANARWATEQLLDIATGASKLYLAHQVGMVGATAGVLGGAPTTPVGQIGAAAGGYVAGATLVATVAYDPVDQMAAGVNNLTQSVVGSVVNALCRYLSAETTTEEGLAIEPGSDQDAAPVAELDCSASTYYAPVCEDFQREVSYEHEECYDVAPDEMVCESEIISYTETYRECEWMCVPL